MIEIRQVSKRYTRRDGTEVAALLDVDLREGRYGSSAWSRPAVTWSE